MGEVLALALVVTALVFGGAGIAYAVGNRGRLRAIEATPLAGIDPADSGAALTKAQQYFRLAQGSVRVMEALLADDMVRPLIPEARRVQMQALVDRFYEL